MDNCSEVATNFTTLLYRLCIENIATKLESTASSYDILKCIAGLTLVMHVHITT